jgi:hypothetical protein
VECYDDDWQTRCAAEESHPQTKKLCTPCPDAEQSPNFDDPVHNCAFCGMFRCEPTQGGVWQQFGETVLDVIGVSGDQCEVRIIGEVEGGVKAYECSWPLGLAPWPAIVNIANFGELPAEIAPYCTLVDNCSLLDNNCAETYPSCCDPLC